MQSFKALFIHEWRLLIREPRFMLLLCLPSFLLLVVRFINADTFSVLPLEFAKFLLLLLGAMNSTMTLPFSADAFAGERERNTLELLQLSPVSPRKIYFVKLLTILPFSIFGAVFSQIILFLICSNIPLDVFAKAILGATSFALLFNGLTLLLSLRSKTVRAATQTAAIISFPFYFLIQAWYPEFFSISIFPFAFFLISVVSLLLCVHFSLKKFLLL